VAVLLKNSHYPLKQPIYRKILPLDCANHGPAKKIVEEDVAEGRMVSEWWSRQCAKRKWAKSGTKLWPPKMITWDI